ncbi:MAG: DUF424 family protein [Candidatus ainarchaeum sp.]|nr:DUF424 family protein [Candidatus ainarchaeum sp.]
MYLKIHQTKDGKVIAACDRELIGKVLEEDKYYIDLKTYSSFYKGELCTEKQLADAFANFYSANLIGKKTTSVAISKKLVSEEDIILIKGFPFIQIYRF